MAEQKDIVEPNERGISLTIGCYRGSNTPVFGDETLHYKMFESIFIAKRGNAGHRRLNNSINCPICGKTFSVEYDQKTVALLKGDEITKEVYEKAKSINRAKIEVPYIFLAIILLLSSLVWIFFPLHIHYI